MNGSRLVFLAIVGMMTSGAGALRADAQPTANAPLLAGCGDTPFFPEVSFVRMHGAPLPMNPVVWVTGTDMVNRAMGLSFFGGSIEPRAQVLVRGSCDQTGFEYREVPVENVLEIGASIIISPTNPNEQLSTVLAQDIDVSFVPVPTDTLTLVAFSETQQGSGIFFQELVLLSNCDALLSSWCEVISGRSGEELPMMGMAFDGDRLIGLVSGKSWNPGAEAFSFVSFFSRDPRAIDLAQAVPVEKPAELIGFISTEGSTEVPFEFSMGSPWPNPTTGPVQFSISIDTPQHIRAEVFDPVGRSITTLEDGFLPSGPHVLRFDGEGLPPGVYLVRIAGERAVRTARVVLVR